MKLPRPITHVKTADHVSVQSKGRVRDNLVDERQVEVGEAIAVAEANTLRVPVVAILDSNSSPDGIAYPIPGNDDAMLAFHLYCDLVSGAVLDGLQAELAASGVDIGARADLAQQAIPEEISDEFPALQLPEDETVDTGAVRLGDGMISDEFPSGN